jgi:putative ABC transport system substrate-binding protein
MAGGHGRMPFEDAINDGLWDRPWRQARGRIARAGLHNLNRRQAVHRISFGLIRVLIAFGLIFGVAEAKAQHRRPPPHVGILNYAGPNDLRVRQFRDALRVLGYREDGNIKLMHKWADGKMEALPALAAQLVSDRADVIIALGPAVWAAKTATTTIPIVIAFSGDPIGQKIANNLAKPGGNITGFSYMSTDLAEKRLELISEYFSISKRVAVLFSVNEPATTFEIQRMGAVASALGVTLVSAPVDKADQLDEAFLSAVGAGADTMVVLTHGFAVLNAERIMALAGQHRLPVLYGWHDFVAAGGLMSYGPDVEGLVRRAAGYVDRLLRGEKAGNLPIELPTLLLLSINLNTAKSLGIKVPEALLLRADRIIE